MQKQYISKNHSKFLVKYHVIFVCKYRKQVLRDKRIDDDIKQAVKLMAVFCPKIPMLFWVDVNPRVWSVAD